MIKETMKHFWKDDKVVVIGGVAVIVILAIV